MLKLKVITIILFIASPGLMSQPFAITLEKFNGNGNIGMIFSTLRKKMGLESDLPTIGSVYLNDQFVPCIVYYRDDNVGQFYYRHNAYNDEIEIKDTKYTDEPASSLATIKELRLLETLNNTELSLMVYKNAKGETRNGYLYRIISGAQFNLYFKNNVKFKEGTHPATSMTRPTPNKFSHYIEYYIKKGASEVVF